MELTSSSICFAVWHQPEDSEEDAEADSVAGSLEDSSASEGQFHACKRERSGHRRRILDEPDDIESFEDEDDLSAVDIEVVQPPKKKAATGSTGQGNITSFFGKLPLGASPHSICFTSQ